MKLTYHGDQARTYVQYIDVGGDAPKTLEAVPGETYHVIPASGMAEEIPTDGLWEKPEVTAPAKASPEPESEPPSAAPPAAPFAPLNTQGA